MWPLCSDDFDMPDLEHVGRMVYVYLEGCIVQLDGTMEREDVTKDNFHCQKQDKGGGERGLCSRGRYHSMKHHSINL
jgi:hypothetical protein